MLLSKLSMDDKERISSGNMEILRRALDKEETMLIDRLLAEKKDIQFIQGAAAFCRSLRLIIK